MSADDTQPVTVVETAAAPATHQSAASAALADIPQTPTHYFKDFDPNNIRALPLQRSKFGTESAPLKDLENNDIVIQFPRLPTEWGFNCFKKDPEPGKEPEKPSYSIGVSVDPESRNPTVRAFREFITRVEDRIKVLAKENQAKWFPQEDGDVTGLCKPTIVRPKPDKPGLPKITMNINENKGKPFNFDVRVYLPKDLNTPVDPHIITRNSELIIMAKMSKISLWGGRYQLKFEIDHCVVYASAQITGNHINLNRDDEEFADEESRPAKKARSDE